ncbi:hypothetical protein BOX15_Mlig029816g2, partial [Macrostomum lignano]
SNRVDGYVISQYHKLRELFGRYETAHSVESQFRVASPDTAICSEHSEDELAADANTLRILNSELEQRDLAIQKLTAQVKSLSAVNEKLNIDLEMQRTVVFEEMKNLFDKISKIHSELEEDSCIRNATAAMLLGQETIERLVRVVCDLNGGGDSSAIRRQEDPDASLSSFLAMVKSDRLEYCACLRQRCSLSSGLSDTEAKVQSLVSDIQAFELHDSQLDHLKRYLELDSEILSLSRNCLRGDSRNIDWRPGGKLHPSRSYPGIGDQLPGVISLACIEQSAAFASAASSQSSLNKSAASEVAEFQQKVASLSRSLSKSLDVFLESQRRVSISAAGPTQPLRPSKSADCIEDSAAEEFIAEINSRGQKRGMCDQGTQWEAPMFTYMASSRDYLDKDSSVSGIRVKNLTQGEVKIQENVTNLDSEEMCMHTVVSESAVPSVVFNVSSDRPHKLEKGTEYMKTTTAAVGTLTDETGPLLTTDIATGRERTCNAAVEFVPCFNSVDVATLTSLELCDASIECQQVFKQDASVDNIRQFSSRYTSTDVSDTSDASTEFNEVSSVEASVTCSNLLISVAVSTEHPLVSDAIVGSDIEFSCCEKAVQSVKNAKEASISTDVLLMSDASTDCECPSRREAASECTIQVKNASCGAERIEEATNCDEIVVHDAAIECTVVLSSSYVSTETIEISDAGTNCEPKIVKDAAIDCLLTVRNADLSTEVIRMTETSTNTPNRTSTGTITDSCFSGSMDVGTDTPFDNFAEATQCAGGEGVKGKDVKVCTPQLERFEASTDGTEMAADQESLAQVFESSDLRQPADIATHYQSTSKVSDAIKGNEATTTSTALLDSGFVCREIKATSDASTTAKMEADTRVLVDASTESFNQALVNAEVDCSIRVTSVCVSTDAFQSRDAYTIVSSSDASMDSELGISKAKVLMDSQKNTDASSAPKHSFDLVDHTVVHPLFCDAYSATDKAILIDASTDTELDSGFPGFPVAAEMLDASVQCAFAYSSDSVREFFGAQNSKFKIEADNESTVHIMHIKERKMQQKNSSDSAQAADQGALGAANTFIVSDASTQSAMRKTRSCKELFTSAFNSSGAQPIFPSSNVSDLQEGSGAPSDASLEFRKPLLSDSSVDCTIMTVDAHTTTEYFTAPDIQYAENMTSGTDPSSTCVPSRTENTRGFFHDQASVSDNNDPARESASIAESKVDFPTVKSLSESGFVTSDPACAETVFRQFDAALMTQPRFGAANESVLEVPTYFQSDEAKNHAVSAPSSLQMEVMHDYVQGDATFELDTTQQPLM